MAAEDARVLALPASVVLFTDFGESSLDFVLLVWIPDPLLEPVVTSDLRFAIDAAFRQRGDRDPSRSATSIFAGVARRIGVILSPD